MGAAPATQAMMAEFEKGEICPKTGEPIIAVDEKNPEVYGCNTCVFYKRLERPRFLVAAAKRTKKRIDVQYGELVKNLEEIDKLEPDKFMQRFENEVSAYFTTLHRNIKEVEKELIS